jgi:hypothetical protein
MANGQARMTSGELNPYQAPSDISTDAETPLTAEDATQFSIHDPLAGPAAICLVVTSLVMVTVGLVLLPLLIGVVFGRSGSWGGVACAFAVVLAAGFLHFAGHAMLNRRHRLVVIFAAMMGLFTGVLTLPCLLVLLRISGRKVWNSFRD